MSDTLTQLIARLQDQLIDDGTRFNTDTCTVAIRKTLAEMNRRIPIIQAELVDAIQNQQTYEVNDIDSRVIGISDILRYDQTNAEQHIPLAYDAFVEDERYFFRLRVAENEGEIIVVRYYIPHTINGLASQTTSTLSTDLDQVLIDGACADALSIRAAARAETVNIQKNVQANYKDAIAYFKDAFNKGMKAAILARKEPVAEPRTDSWQDPYTLKAWDT